jgi:putative restriction endonuclease
VPENSKTEFVDYGSWRIEMLANNSGFPITQGRDEFGYRFSGPGLDQKSVSIRWTGQDTLAMRVPSSVSTEMRKDAESGAHYSVDAAGLVVFGASGPHADKAIRRAAALIRALPDAPLAAYWERTRTMAANTEAERLVKQRIGQDIFRASLEDYWSGRCPITGVADRALLRASHTRPWAACETDEERLDVYNGFLLAAHLDAAFDAALMTFDDEGGLLWSSKLSGKAKSILKDGGVKQIRLAPAHQTYLAHHHARFRVQEAI